MTKTLSITHSYKHIEQLVGKSTLSSPSQQVSEELFINNQLKNKKNSKDPKMRSRDS
jgi:hypothetical protein